MDIESRIRRLERRCRLHRNLFVLAGLGAATLAAYAVAIAPNGAAAEAPPIIQARRFEVIGPQGRKMATLHHTNDGSGGLTIYNQRGAPIIQAGINRNGHGVLEVLNSARRPILDVYAEADGRGVVKVCGPRSGQCRNLSIER